MWSVRDTSNGQRYHFLVGGKYTIGRKQNTIVIIADPSISRRHAIFEVDFNVFEMDNISKSSLLRVRDVDSKYGTFVNELPISTGEDRKLNPGDVVKFGLFDAEFVVCHEPLIVCISCIEKGKKLDLKFMLHRLGGHLVEDWQSSCTHLVMPRVKFTVKAICCLVSLKPIVTYEYFADLIECWTCRSVERKLEEKCYIPPACEEQMDEDANVFNICEGRRTVFDDMLFFFFNENQLKRLQFIILSAGGNTVLIKKDRAFDPDLLTNQGSCIIKPCSMAFSSKLLKIFNEVSEILSGNKKRLIPESDIGMAIIHCSVENYCNPDYHEAPTASGYHKIASQTVSENQIFVEDTNDVTRAGPSSNNCFNLDSPKAGCSRDIVIDCIEIEESQDGFLEEKKSNEDDDVIFVTAKKSNDNDEVQVISGPVPSTNKSRRPGISGFKAKRAKLQPSVIEVLDVSSTEEDSSEESSQEEESSKNKESSKNHEEPPGNQEEPPENQEKPPENQEKPPESREQPPGSQEEPPETHKEPPGSQEEPPENHKEPPGSQEELPENQDERSENEEPSKYSAVPADLGNRGDAAENQPSSGMKVKFVDLINPKKVEDVSGSKNKNGVKNFKRFKKVPSLGTLDLPRIIGGRDLITYDPYSLSSNRVKDMIKNLPRDSDESEGEFDW